MKKENNTSFKKQKLLVTASTFPRWEKDTEPRFVLDLCRHMTDKYDITVLAPAALGAQDQEVLEGVRVIRYHYFPIHKWETLCYPGAIVPRIKEKKIRILLVPFLFLGLYIKLLKILPEYDIVHAHWLVPQGIVQSLFKKSYIVTGHGGDVTSLNKCIWKKIKIRTLKKASNVTVVSEYLREKIKELLPECDPCVISMGVDTSKFGKQYYCQNYFNQKNEKVVLFVGRLAEKKGVTYLIEAMKYVEAVCVIVGDGPLKNRLILQAEEQGNKLRFLGSKTHDELKTIYASSDIFVAPSITAKDGDSEGMPTTIMEAMASGLPVIASSSSGIKEIITNEENGILCEEKSVSQLSNSIRKLLEDEKLYQKIAANGMITAEQYDYGRIAEQYKNII